MHLIDAAISSLMGVVFALADLRQWPEVYDLCHTFLHVVRVKNPTDMQETHAKRGSRARSCEKRTRNTFRMCFSHVCVFFDLRNVQKRATKSDNLGHCLADLVQSLDMIQCKMPDYFLNQTAFCTCNNTPFGIPPARAPGGPGRGRPVGY